MIRHKLQTGIICIFVSLLVYLLAIPNAVRAQEVSLSISPPLTELTIQPGRSFSQVFTVKNNGVPVTVVAKIFPFVPFDRQGHAELIEDANSINAFTGWFFFDPNPTSLGTTASHDFYVKITPPAGAEEKDYYFTFIAEVQSDNGLGINNSKAQSRIGANLLVSVSKGGTPGKKASIITFAAPKIIDSFSGLTYEVLIGNLGSSFFKPVGKITVDQADVFRKYFKLMFEISGDTEVLLRNNELLIDFYFKLVGSLKPESKYDDWSRATGGYSRALSQRASFLDKSNQEEIPKALARLPVYKDNYFLCRERFKQAVVHKQNPSSFDKHFDNYMQSLDFLIGKSSPLFGVKIGDFSQSDLIQMKQARYILLLQ